MASRQQGDVPCWVGISPLHALISALNGAVAEGLRYAVAGVHRM